MKWAEAFSGFSCRVVGTRVIQLLYVIRETVYVPVAAPPFMANQPYAEILVSVKEELIAYASHLDDIYREDNAAL